MRKISQVPIRYIVYSHHHDDHISGGSAFGDEAVVVGHANVSGDSGGSIVPVDMTFSDLMSFHLGDLEVQLIYPGPSETDSNIIVLVPERKVAFMVDAVASRRLPWCTFGNANPSEWLAALKELDRLDFEILAPGHGAIGTKANGRRIRPILHRLDRGGPRASRSRANSCRDSRIAGTSCLRGLGPDTTSTSSST